MSYIQLTTGTTGDTYYAVFYSQETGCIWDNSAEQWSDTTASLVSGNGALDYGADWADVAVTMTEDVGSSADSTGHYQLQVPATLEAVVECVDVIIRQQADVAPLVTDPIIASGTHCTRGTYSYTFTKTG